MYVSAPFSNLAWEQKSLTEDLKSFVISLNIIKEQFCVEVLLCMNPKLLFLKDFIVPWQKLYS